MNGKKKRLCEVDLLGEGKKNGKMDKRKDKRSNDRKKKQLPKIYRILPFSVIFNLFFFLNFVFFTNLSFVSCLP